MKTFHNFIFRTILVAMNRIVTTLIVGYSLLSSFLISAQEYKVKSLEIEPRDLDARVNPRVDANGRKCALLKFYVEDCIDQANGSIVGEIQNRGMEKRIYMTHDSKQIELAFDKHFPLRIKFDDYNMPVLTEQTVYVLKLVGENTSSINTEVANIDNQRITAEGVNTLYDKTIDYMYGRNGMKENLVMAIELMSRAADADLAAAQTEMGLCNENGRGVPQDYYKAVEWYQKATNQGYSSAQKRLDSMKRR